LFNSEKSYRKKKVAKAIVDLSKCFNVSQQVFFSKKYFQEKINFKELPKV